jgi:hypothetical protein
MLGIHTMRTLPHSNVTEASTFVQFHVLALLIAILFGTIQSELLVQLQVLTVSGSLQ